LSAASLRGVDQHDLDPGIGRDIGDASAHHSRADDADLLHPLIGNIRAVRTLLQRLLVEEERPDHGRRRRVHQDGGEPARLDPERGVEIDKRAFVDGREQRLGRRVDALGLAVDHRRGADEGHEARRMIRRAAGHLVALLVPRLDDVRVTGRQHPFPGARQQLPGGHDLIDQQRGLRLPGVQHLAFQKHRGRLHCADHAGIADRAAAAGEDADEDLRQADLGLGIVGHEAAVTGERDLGADARTGAGMAQATGLPPLLVLGSMPARSSFRRMRWPFMVKSNSPWAGSSPASARMVASAFRSMPPAKVSLPEVSTIPLTASSASA
jgi:hypothetical protein